MFRGTEKYLSAESFSWSTKHYRRNTWTWCFKKQVILQNPSPTPIFCLSHIFLSIICLSDLFILTSSHSTSFPSLLTSHTTTFISVPPSPPNNSYAPPQPPSLTPWHHALKCTIPNSWFTILKSYLLPYQLIGFSMIGFYGIRSNQQWKTMFKILTKRQTNHFLKKYC